MKKTDEQERNIASRLYNLDKKVYETTGSTLGRVFPSSPSFALEKIIDSLKINREYFLKNEMTLIANMIPMSIVLQIAWIIVVVIWMMIGLPFGPGVGVALPAGIL